MAEVGDLQSEFVSEPFGKRPMVCETNVRFWLLADFLTHPEKGLLYPRKRTFGG